LRNEHGSTDAPASAVEERAALARLTASMRHREKRSRFRARRGGAFGKCWIFQSLLERSDGLAPLFLGDENAT
jgi:hypothetical protein